MPPLHPSLLWFDPLESANYSKAMRWAYRRPKTNREENLTKHVGAVYAYVKKVKNRKTNDEEGGDKQKKQDS